MLDLQVRNRIATQQYIEVKCQAHLLRLASLTRFEPLIADSRRHLLRGRTAVLGVVRELLAIAHFAISLSARVSGCDAVHHAQPVPDLLSVCEVVDAEEYGE